MKHDAGPRAFAWTPLVAMIVATFGVLAPSTGSAQRSKSPSGWVGISVIQHGRGDNASGLSMEYPVVAAVEPGSPAATAGITAGDTILAYNDVDAHTDPMAVSRFLHAGQRLIVKVRRNGVRDLAVTVAKRAPRSTYRVSMDAQEVVNNAIPTIARIGAPVPNGLALAGARIAQLNAGLANALDVRTEGVLVVDVAPNTPAVVSGLEPGDIIVRANSVTVPTTADLVRAIHAASDHSVQLDVVRKGKAQKITLRW